MTKQALTPWHGPEVWTGEEVAARGDWLFRLSAAHLEELHAAARATLEAGLAIAEIGPDDVALPGLAPALRDLDAELREGRGFVVLRGLPLDAWSLEEAARAYWALGLALGEPISQNGRGHLLGHVIDQRVRREATQRVYETALAQPFHSDSCDIVGLLCLREAMLGGESAVASAAAIHNYLLKTAPRRLARLYEPFHCDRYGEIPAGKAEHYPARIFNRVGGHLTCCAMDPDIRSGQRHADAPRLEADDVAALDAFQEAAHALAFKMRLEPGDIQFVHNHTVAHARAAFQDHPELERRRHLLRLWLSSPRGRRLPAFLKERWGVIEPGARRGGVVVPGARATASLDPKA